jgi:hypothetical protein
MNRTASPTRALRAVLAVVLLLLPVVHIHTDGPAFGMGATRSAAGSGPGVQADSPQPTSTSSAAPCLACLLAQQTTGRLTELPGRAVVLPQARRFSPGDLVPVLRDDFASTDPRGPPLR